MFRLNETCCLEERQLQKRVREDGSRRTTPDIYFTDYVRQLKYMAQSSSNQTFRTCSDVSQFGHVIEPMWIKEDVTSLEREG